MRKPLTHERSVADLGAPEVKQVVQDSAGKVVHDCGAGELVTLLGTDQFVELTLAGGSGYGEPLARLRSAVAHDVAMGWITPGGAARDYGCADAAQPGVGRAVSADTLAAS